MRTEITAPTAADILTALAARPESPLSAAPPGIVRPAPFAGHPAPAAAPACPAPDAVTSEKER